MGNSGNGRPSCGSTLLCSLAAEDVDANDSAAVFLNVYDLSEDWLHANNIFVDVLRLGGAFHTGVEAHGKEWSFGQKGVTRSTPRRHDVHVYRQSVPMGLTMCSAAEVLGIIERDLLPRWRGEDYELFRRNCCSFSDVLCRRLCGKPIPLWVNRFPKLALAARRRWSKMVDMIPRQPTSMDYAVSDTTMSAASSGIASPTSSSSSFEPPQVTTPGVQGESEFGTSIASSPVHSPSSTPAHRADCAQDREEAPEEDVDLALEPEVVKPCYLAHGFVGGTMQRQSREYEYPADCSRSGMLQRRQT